LHKYFFAEKLKSLLLLLRVQRIFFSCVRPAKPVLIIGFLFVFLPLENNHFYKSKK